VKITSAGTARRRGPVRASSISAFFAVCLAAVAGQAQAQNADVSGSTTEVKLPSLMVDGEGDDAEASTQSYGSPITSVASRTPAHVREIPFSVSVLTRRRLDDELLFDDADAIGRMTGMNVSGSPHGQEISSRGFSTLSNVDGLRSSSEDSNFTPVLDTFLLERIDVLRGPAGLLEGAGDPGGVVSTQLKRPLDRVAGKATLSLGSNAFGRGEFDVSGPVGRDSGLRMRFAGAYTDREFFYDVADQQKIALLATGELDLSSRTTVRVAGVYQRDNRTPSWGLPSHEDGYLLDLDRSTFVGSRNGRFDTDYGLINAELRHQLTDQWTARIIASHFDQRLDELSLVAISPAFETPTGLAVELGNNINKDHERGDNIDASLSGHFMLFGQEHKLTIGASYITSKLSVDEGWSNDAFLYDLQHPNYDLPVPPTRDGGVRQERDYRQHGVYGQLNAKVLDWFTLIGGGRLNWARLKSDITGRFVPDYKKNGFFTPMLGVVLDVTPTTSLYASYADIFRVQFQRDRNGDPLPPLTGTQYEAGIKSELFEGLVATASVFDITRKNEAFLVSNGPPRVFEADGKTKSRGAEVELNGRITPSWQITAGYAYTDFRITESRDPRRVGRTAGNTPEHKFNLWTSYLIQDGALRGLQASAGATIVSEIFDYSNDLRAPGYNTIDAALRYRISDALTLRLKATNLLDETYYERLGSSGLYHYYGAPRSVLGQVEVAF
jgi:TonB-dependent siderophore receptor